MEPGKNPLLSQDLNGRRVVVEVLTASSCGRCRQARELAKAVIANLHDPRIEFRELDVVDKIDYAVRLGVLNTPAIVLNGELVFSATPSKGRLEEAIQRRLGEYR